MTASILDTEKPILTLHNVLCILNDHLPLHCGTRYLVKFDSKTNEPYISDSFIKADDMGRASLFNKSDNNSSDFKEGVPYFLVLKQEHLHVWMDLVNIQKCRWRREIGYNKHAGTNVTNCSSYDYTEVSNGQS